jgi:hypothetical protein
MGENRDDAVPGLRGDGEISKIRDDGFDPDATLLSEQLRFG